MDARRRAKGQAIGVIACAADCIKVYHRWRSVCNGKGQRGWSETGQAGGGRVKRGGWAREGGGGMAIEGDGEGGGGAARVGRPASGPHARFAMLRAAGWAGLEHTTAVWT